MTSTTCLSSLAWGMSNGVVALSSSTAPGGAFDTQDDMVASRLWNLSNKKTWYRGNEMITPKPERMAQCATLAECEICITKKRNDEKMKMDLCCKENQVTSSSLGYFPMKSFKSVKSVHRVVCCNIFSKFNWGRTNLNQQQTKLPLLHQIGISIKSSHHHASSGNRRWLSLQISLSIYETKCFQKYRNKNQFMSLCIFSFIMSWKMFSSSSFLCFVFFGP